MIRSRGHVPWAAIGFAVVAAFMALPLAFSANAWHYPFYLFPAAISLALFCSISRRFEATLFGDRLDVIKPAAISIPFDRIESIQIVPGSARKPGAISAKVLALTAGSAHAEIPGNLSVPTPGLVEAVLARCGFGGRSGAHPLIESYRRRMLEQFGPSKLYSYSARRRSASQGSRLAILVGAALVLADIAFVVLAGKAGRDTAIGVSCISIVFGALLVIVGAASNAVSRKLENSELTIGPLGIAVAQDELVGELTWSEIRDLRFGTVVAGEAGSLRLRRNNSGLLIKVEGAQIAIADIYDRPIEAIYRVMRLLWKGSDTCCGCGQAINAATGPACARCYPALFPTSAPHPSKAANHPSETATLADPLH